MNDKMIFSEEFIKSLDTLKVDTNKALVYSVHIVSNQKLDTLKKNNYSNDIGNISTELKDIIYRFDLKSITNLNIREREKVFVHAADMLHKSFVKLFENVDKQYNVVIDKRTLFSISDVVKSLKDGSLKAEYLITTDKINNLLSIKTLIIQIYESQIKKAIEKEKDMDRQFIALKEKTYLQMIRGESNSNAEYFFKTCELIRKYISLDIKSMIIDEKTDEKKDVIQYFGDGSSGLSLFLSTDGLSIYLRIGKLSNGSNLIYDIGGYLEKGTAKVEYSVRESISFDKEIVFERVSGLDCILEQYEKAVIEEKNRDNVQMKYEVDINKDTLNKAIDDILFK